MNERQQLIPVAGLLATIALAMYCLVGLHAQAAAAQVNGAEAAMAEVHDAQGQVVLRGQFGAAVEDDDGEFERKATLEGTGIDSDAAGEAELEYGTDAGAPEVEFSANNVAANAAFTFVVDGHTVATARSDRRGRVEAEVSVNAPATR